MTYEELYYKITEILPTATFSADNYGQLIIYTDKQFGDDSHRTLVPFEVKEDEPTDQ